MTNAEIRMTNDETMMKPEAQNVALLTTPSSFVIRVSFVIWISSFVISSPLFPVP
jgi:hypothetical protein